MYDILCGIYVGISGKPASPYDILNVGATHQISYKLIINHLCCLNAAASAKQSTHHCCCCTAKKEEEKQDLYIAVVTNMAVTTQQVPWVQHSYCLFHY